MTTNKKVKRKVSIKKIIILLIIILIISLSVVYIMHVPLKNIYISGNNLVTDKEIIKISGLGDYPPYIDTYFMNIKEKLLENDYIKEVRIKRKLFGKIYIEIEEYRPLFIYNDKLVLSSKNKVDNTLKVDYVPYLINNIDDIFDKFVTSFSVIEDDVLLKISQIEYVPNEVDKERFIFYMVDNNYVYITISKIDKVNKYNSIINKMDGKKGIIYLDSGDYVEIKG